MNSFIQSIKNANICYVVLIILLFLVMNIYLKNKRINRQYKTIVNIIFLGIVFVSFSYINGIIQNIFQLKYLSVKTYLLIVASTNLIILLTLNKKIKLGYTILNYILFITMTIIFGSTLAIILGNKFEKFYVMDVANAVNFIDLSLVIFMIYVIIISLMYIGYCLFESSSKRETNTLNKMEEQQKEICFIENIILKMKKDKKKKLPEEEQLSREELLNHNKEEKFYIKGVECSIIFDDSNQENIIKNYHILLNDIHAKLVNGYTLEENQMLKNICMKLKVGNLANIDIDNVSLLNRISVEEYNLLKKVFR